MNELNEQLNGVISVSRSTGDCFPRWAKKKQAKRFWVKKKKAQEKEMSSPGFEVWKMPPGRSICLSFSFADVSTYFLFYFLIRILIYHTDLNTSLFTF